MTQKIQLINPETIHNNPINNSTSKMLYSFPKNSRFKKQNFLDIPFYTLPDIDHKRTTTLGVGEKSRFEDTRGFPSPDKYNVNRDFDKKSRNGFSFGVGRQKIKADSMTMFKNSVVPGPGTYQPKLIKDSRSAKVRSRTQDHSLDEAMKVPGPGAYQSQIVSAMGKTLNSKYQSVRSLIMPRSKSSNLRKRQSVPSPAPWAYNPIITRKGQRPINKGKCYQFSLSRREGFTVPNKNPGPGQYNSFSEFKK